LTIIASHCSNFAFALKYSPGGNRGVPGRNFEGKMTAALLHAGIKRARVAVARSSNGSFMWWAGKPETRAAEFMAFVKDPAVTTIFINSWSDGVCNILELLDYNAIRKTRKAIVGGGDAACLLNAVAMRSRLRTFYGPAAQELVKRSKSDADVEHVLVLDRMTTFRAQESWAISLFPGVVTGPLYGGQLRSLATIVGTRELTFSVVGSTFFFEAPTTPHSHHTRARTHARTYTPAYLPVEMLRGAILFLHDDDQATYWVDRVSVSNAVYKCTCSSDTVASLQAHTKISPIVCIGQRFLFC
jgi:muramoyltetrapeptide carboxypeptidase LdcA involved in peptidoglycan recycling